MNILKKWTLFGSLLFFCTCHQPLKPTNSVTYQLINNGQFPIKIPITTSNNSKRYFKIIDKRQAKNYPAQRLNDSTLLFLVADPNFKISDAIHIEESNRPFSDNQIQIKKTTDALIVTKNNQPVLTYQITEKLPEGKASHYKRGGFIHPLYSPNGKILSDDFPEGHTHQHGIFFAFVNTTFKNEKLDFWNQHQSTGTIEFSKLNNYQSGPVFGIFETEQNHISLTQGVILKEKWQVIIYNTEPYRLEIQTTLQNVSTDTLFINDYHYGGMAFRGAKAWNTKDSLHFQNEPTFRTNEGKDRIAANHSRPLWSALSGLIDGEHVGVVMLGHSNNFRHPQPIRIHPSMPYYCSAPMVGKQFSIAPNGIFEGNYTYLSFDGILPTGFLNELVKTLE